VELARRLAGFFYDEKPFMNRADKSVLSNGGSRGIGLVNGLMKHERDQINSARGSLRAISERG
jgi:hypothetical protein